MFLPLINAYRVGQVQTLLNLPGDGRLAFLWLRGKRIASAVLIGLTCWLKPQMSLYLLWGLLRKQWSFAISLSDNAARRSLRSRLPSSAGTTRQNILQVLHFLSRRGMP